MKACGCTGTLPCGCCAGIEPVTPESEFNRPGLPALRYRAGTHATFLETMEAALSRERRLDGLSSRESDDASIALLDAWAIVGDVLTFYQERIANEGYLATATERRSVLELANLVGYRPRPGVSASVVVAYTLDDGAKASIPAGSIVRSVPADGESQQAFETEDPLDAQAAWNNLQVRLTRPHTTESIRKSRAVYLKGIVSSVHPGDPLFVAFSDRKAALCRVLAVEQDAATDRTRIGLEEWVPSKLFASESASDEGPSNVSVDDIATKAGLLTPASLPPRSQYHRSGDLGVLFGPAAGKAPQISGSALATLTAFRPAFRQSLATALAGARVTEDAGIRVYSVMRTAPFGHNAAPRAQSARVTDDGTDSSSFTTTWHEWPLDVPADANENKEPIPDKIDLEKEFEGITEATLVAVQTESTAYVLPELKSVTVVARTAYGLAGKSTQLKFTKALFKKKPSDLSLLRPVKVFLAAKPLPLAEQPIADPVCGSDDAIELNGLYDGLTPGKWMILAGERADTAGTSGVRATELLLIADVQHRTAPKLPGDRLHTFLRPVVPSGYCYKRDTVRIYGNVVKATNGETRKEVLGSGDASVGFQAFPLKQPPLTHLPAPTASGADSTLHVYVNDVEWREADGPVGLAPYDRRFFTKTADDGTTTVMFGDGVTGARLPTGTANVRATYRNGIGKAGNVDAGQLTILGSKPPGVKEVGNPLRASGGAEKDSRDQIRVNAPISVTALDRLVSVDDYAHFAQTFAGIGKALATLLSDGHRQLVHVTIAGIDDIPIDVTSDLYRNLHRAMRLLGDPALPLQIGVRTARFLVLQASVKVSADYPWESMAPTLRDALLDAFRFERRSLGQSAFLSEVLDVLQRVPGVEFIDADKFGSLSESDLTPSGIGKAIGDLTRRDEVIAEPARNGKKGIDAAEIVYFTPDVPATIVLNQL
jgi:predicted phage baseplate assembly protein